MKPRLVIAVIVLLAGAAMAVRAVLPLLPKREPVVVYTPEGLTPFDAVRFGSARTGRTPSDAEIASVFRERLRAVETSPPLDDEAVESIATRASDRLRMVLGAGPTLEEIRLADGAPSEGSGEVRGDRDRWEAHWRYAPVSLGDVTVRFIPSMRSEEGARGNHHLGMSVRASLRGRYARNSEDLPTLQISIPARPTTVAAGGGKRVPVYLAFAYQHDPTTGRWNFVDCIVYTPDSTVPPPAF